MFDNDLTNFFSYALKLFNHIGDVKARYSDVIALLEVSRINRNKIYASPCCHNSLRFQSQDINPQTPISPEKNRLSNVKTVRFYML